jgi:TPR repeat protein
LGTPTRAFYSGKKRNETDGNMFLRRSEKPKTSQPFRQPTVQELYRDKDIQKIAAKAREGDLEAQYQMGVYHSESNPRDVVLSLMYLRDAANCGHLPSRSQIAMTIMKGFDDPLAQGSFCGFCALLPLKMRSFNVDEPWFIEEARAGSNTFRFLYSMGNLAQNKEHEAFALLDTDARVGSMLAMGALGYCYSSGIGAPQNYSEAYVWSSLAATAGLRLAAEDRSWLAEKLTAATLERAQEKATELFGSIFEPRPAMASRSTD